MTRWREHEERSKNTNYVKDYTMYWNKPSKSTGKRPDGWGYHNKDPKKRIIVESKWTTRASPRHINQVQKYKQHPFYANEGILVYPKNAEISKSFKEKAKEKNIKITRTMVPKVKERLPGPKGLLKSKKYRR